MFFGRYEPLPPDAICLQPGEGLTGYQGPSSLATLAFQRYRPCHEDSLSRQERAHLSQTCPPPAYSLAGRRLKRPRRPYALRAMAATQASHTPRACACGCGIVFTPTRRKDQRYVDGTHCSKARYDRRVARRDEWREAVPDSRIPNKAA